MKALNRLVLAAGILLSASVATARPAVAAETPQTNPVLGSLGELSLKTDNLAHSIRYWTELGFHAVGQATEPYPYAILADGQTVIGLHQDPGFTGPLLTYFAPDMSERIARLQTQGMTFVRILKDDRGHVFGGILKSPEGQLIFLAEWKQAEALRRKHGRR